MKKILLIISILAFFFQSCEEEKFEVSKVAGSGLSNLSSSGWEQVALFPGGGRIAAFGLSIGTKGYIGTGATSNTDLPDFAEYDPATNKWTRKADFPGGNRKYAGCFTIGDKGYIGLGLGYGIPGVSNGFRNDLWEYAPATNTWTKKADFPATPYAPNAVTAFTIGNKGYVGIFCGDFQLYEYNPEQNKWSKKASFPGGNRYGVVAFSVGSKGYVGLGIEHNKDGVDSFMNDIWEYNPDTNTWIRKTDFPGGPRGQAVAFTIKNKGYVGTGISSRDYETSLKSDIWEYNPVNDTWELQNLTRLPARSEAVGFSIGNSGYIGVGFNLISYHYQSDFWKFTVQE